MRGITLFIKNLKKKVKGGPERDFLSEESEDPGTRRTALTLEIDHKEKASDKSYFFKEIPPITQILEEKGARISRAVAPRTKKEAWRGKKGGWLREENKNQKTRGNTGGGTEVAHGQYPKGGGVGQKKIGKENRI